MRSAPKSELRGSRRGSGDTRVSLLRAAEKLFAARGVDAVSLREVSVAAGQANNSAVAYHFGSREGLVDAILERHSTPIQARYDAQSELLERQGGSSLRTLVEVLVLPIVGKLDDPDGGWEYLSLAAQLSVNPRLPLAERPVAQTPAVLRLMGLMAPFTRTPSELMLFRFDRLANTIYASIVSWHRLSRGGFVGVPRQAFEQDLVDSLVDILQRAPSPETRAALAAPPATARTGPSRGPAAPQPTAKPAPLGRADGAKAARPPTVKPGRRPAKASRSRRSPRQSRDER